MVLDTASINFGISKLSQAWNNAAPHLQNMSEKYVRYVVAKAVLIPVILFIPSIVGIVLLIKGVIELKKDESSGAGMACTVVGGIIALGCVIGFFCSGYDAVLALWCPQMYTIDNIIGAGK